MYFNEKDHLLKPNSRDIWWELVRTRLWFMTPGVISMCFLSIVMARKELRERCLHHGRSYRRAEKYCADGNISWVCSVPNCYFMSCGVAAKSVAWRIDEVCQMAWQGSENRIVWQFMKEKCNYFRVVGFHTFFVSLCVVCHGLMVHSLGSTGTGFAGLDNSVMHLNA